MVNDLAPLARARRLPVVGELLENYPEKEKLYPVAEPDAVQTEPVGDPPLALLANLARRGHDRALIETLLGWLDGRPLESGLVAWDALTTSLYSDEEAPFVERLRGLARAVKEALPGPAERGANLAEHPATALIERFAQPLLASATLAELTEGAKNFSLGALAALRASGGETAALVASADVLEGVRGFARFLHLARLPSLASVVLDYLWRGLGHKPAFFDLCETMLDAEAPDRIPLGGLPEKEADEPDTRDFLEYLAYRAGVARKKTPDTYALLFTAKKARHHWFKKDEEPTPRFLLCQAELTSRIKDHDPENLVPLAVVDRIAGADDAWRYAARIRVLTAAAQTDGITMEPMELLRDYTQHFGLDFPALYYAMDVAPKGSIWIRDFVRYLAREAAWYPHNKDTWKLLAPIIARGNLKAALAEIDQRMIEQSTL
jgi:hypothetical protein